jgi:hypothetical protein
MTHLSQKPSHLLTLLFRGKPLLFPVSKPVLCFGVCSPPGFFTNRHLQVCAYLQRCLITWSSLSQLKLPTLFPQALVCHVLCGIQQNFYRDIVCPKHCIRWHVTVTVTTAAMHIIFINDNCSYSLTTQFPCMLMYSVTLELSDLFNVTAFYYWNFKVLDWAIVFPQKGGPCHTG